MSELLRQSTNRQVAWQVRYATPVNSPKTSAIQPRALIVTTYGLYARAIGGWIPVGSLIELMASLDVESSAVRTAVSRLKQRGVLDADRRDGVAGYQLTSRGRAILDAGDRRIFERPRATRDDGWLVVVFSVPESERARRHQLRTRLSWLGFGTVSAGVWIAPGHLDDETRDVLAECDLAPYVDLFHADYYAYGDVREQIPRWWDLSALAAMYDEFLAKHSPILRRWSRRETGDVSAAYADYVRTLTAWRRLPYRDPGIAADLLPRGWNGAKAETLFRSIQQLLAEPAQQYVEGVLR